MADDRRPNWGKWRNMPRVEVVEAVALSLNIDPGRVKVNPQSWMAGRTVYDEDAEFADRLQVAVRNLGTDNLPLTRKLELDREKALIDFPPFIVWAISIGWNIPPELNDVRLYQAGQKQKSGKEGQFFAPRRVVAPVVHTQLTIPDTPKFYTVASVPALLAMAVYPRLPPGEGAEIFELRRKNKVITDAGPMLNPLTDADWAELDEIWAALPPLLLPIKENLWQPYADTLTGATKELDWDLVTMRSNLSLEQGIRRSGLETEYFMQLQSAIQSREVSPLSPLTYLPNNLTQGTAGRDALLTLDDIARFAQTLGIEVTVQKGEKPVSLQASPDGRKP